MWFLYSKFSGIYGIQMWIYKGFGPNMLPLCNCCFSIFKNVTFHTIQSREWIRCWTSGPVRPEYPNSNSYMKLLKTKSNWWKKHVYFILNPFETKCDSAHCAHSEVEWDFWFVNFLGWNPVQKQDFCIPLHFLGIKDLKKIEKGQRNFWRSHQTRIGKKVEFS